MSTNARKRRSRLFISLEHPTLAMVKDAASVGLYESVAGKKFACVQLLRIAGLLNGGSVRNIPIMSRI